MAKIELEYEEVTLRHEETGLPTKGVRATCPECGESEDSYGTGSKSRMRCLMRLKENCGETDPHSGKGHYYVDPEADDRPRDPTPKPWWEK
jgi:hypothetical protein